MSSGLWGMGPRRLSVAAVESAQYVSYVYLCLSQYVMASFWTNHSPSIPTNYI